MIFFETTSKYNMNQMEASSYNLSVDGYNSLLGIYIWRLEVEIIRHDSWGTSKTVFKFLNINIKHFAL